MLWQNHTQPTLRLAPIKHPRATNAAVCSESSRNLSPQATALLQRLLLLAPDPIPDLLFDVPIPSAPNENARAALGELIAHELATSDDASGDIRIRTRLHEPASSQRLEKTLAWMLAAFTADPTDPRRRASLSRLLPHAEAIAARGDKAGMVEPANRLIRQIAILLHAKASAAQ